MRLTWLTFAIGGSLGLMTWLCPSMAARLAADDEPAFSAVANSDDRRRALELLRQAAHELRSNRLEAARRLAKEAADLNANYSLFDVRPEHMLAEVERRERNAGSSNGSTGVTASPVGVPPEKRATLPAAASDTNSAFAPTAPNRSATARPESLPPATPSAETSVQSISQVSSAESLRPETTRQPDGLKARAIELLDRGLQALDEQRLDEAERCARAALTLHASFDKLEYKPEYLIKEAGISRARHRLDTATASGTQQSAAAAEASPVTPRKLAATAGPQYPHEVSLSGNEEPQAAPRVASTAPAPSAAPTTPGNAASRERAEQLLQQALGDLQAGHDEVARARIQGALGVMVPMRPIPPMPPASPAVASQAVDPPQPGMPRAGFPNYVPDPTRDERDTALKPMHDPYLGDDAFSTKKSTAVENSLRESTPTYTPLKETLSLERPLPTMVDEMPQKSTAAPTMESQVRTASATQTVSDGDTQSAKVHWPESQAAAPATPSTPMPSYAARPAPQSGAVRPSAAQSLAVQPAPTAPTASTDPRSPYSSRSPYAPPSNAEWAPGTADQPQPGYFHKLWNALIGK